MDDQRWNAMVGRRARTSTSLFMFVRAAHQSPNSSTHHARRKVGEVN
jgi:hypothetical protein